MQFSLNAILWQNYIVDIVLAIFLLAMIFICAKKGFINCFFGIISTTVALLVAVSLAKAVLEMTGGVFGLQGKMEGGFVKFFGKIEGFTSDVSEKGVEAALQEGNVSVILARLVMKMVGNPDTIPVGTTLAMLVGEAMAQLAATLLVGILLFILAKLVMRLLRGVLTTIAERISLIGGINSLLGAIFGLLYGVLIVSAVLALLTVLPFESMTNYLLKSSIVSLLYNHNPIIVVMSWFL